MLAALLPTLNRDDLAGADRLATIRQAFSRGRLPSVMVAPPAITPGGAIAGATKTSSASDVGQHRYLGGAPQKLAIDGTDWVSLRTVSYSADTDIGQIGGSVEFNCDAPKLILNMVGNNAPFRLWIDDQLVAAPPAVQTYVDASKPLIDWTAISSTPTARRYRLDFGGGGSAVSFAGVTTESIYDVWKPAVAQPLRCIVAGDSFTEGTTADGTPAQIAGLSGFANHMGWLLGLDDVWCSGSGGTGWVQTNGSRRALVDRLQADVIAPAPDLAVIAMGINDSGQSAAAVQAAAASCITRFRAALPTAPLFIVGPWAPQTSNVAAVRAAIAAAAAGEASGLTFYIENATAGAEWQSPVAGTIGATTGGGNGDWLVDSAGTHPSVAGHAYLGARLAAAIKAAFAPVTA